MLDALYDESDSNLIDYTIQHGNKEMEKILCEFSVQLYENHYITEASKKSFGDRMKEVFANLIVMVKKFINAVITKYNNMVRGIEYRKKLNQKLVELGNAKAQGVRYVKMQDVWNYKKVFTKINQKLWTDVNNITDKSRHLKLEELERDINTFENDIEKSSNELIKAKEKQRTMSVDDAIKFVQNEINGDTEIFRSLNVQITKYDQYRNKINEFITKYSIVGDGVLDKKKAIISRLYDALAKFTNWIKKFSPLIALAIVGAIAGIII